ncbi:alcohol dehydrogenase catalytic domain-containing protein [Streptomyces sp. NPDC053560]|uniref:alcohol dehydrogenase catalytic domain-containing protein n=1 Tax=Streptomyces sp. NPDC053560 TaxID=3365711 RepID=UPI0037D1F910
MRALTVRPLQPGSLEVREVPDPVAGSGELLADGLGVGVCGTDKEIAAGDYGAPPPGRDRLALGHESLGRVRGAPPGSGFARGDLVLANDAVVGSVNADLRHYRQAADAPAGADQDWPARMITRRVPLSRAQEAFTAREDDIKVVVSLEE